MNRESNEVMTFVCNVKLYELLIGHCLCGDYAVS